MEMFGDTDGDRHRVFKRYNFQLSNGTRISIVFGQGKLDQVCMLIHGFGEGAFAWGRFMHQVPDSYAVAAPDLRGHGHSSWDSAGVYDVDKYVADIAEVIEAIGARSVVLIGHSLGGLIAVQVGRQLGARLRGLMLVDCSPTLSDAAQRQIRADFLAGARPFASPAAYTAWLRDRRPLASDTFLAECAVAALARMGDGTYVRRCDPAIATSNQIVAECFEDTIKALAGMSGATLLVRGHLSGILDRETYLAMAAAARSPIVEIAMAGHAVVSDNPRAFADAAISFLAGLPAPARTGEMLA